VDAPDTRISPAPEYQSRPGAVSTLHYDAVKFIV